jgi:peptide/nickel transport system permease protein
VSVPAAPRIWRRDRSAVRRPTIEIALCFAFLGAVIVCALAGAGIAPHDPAAQNLSLGLRGPGAGHLLGTDQSGRDMLSRVIAGARSAIVGPVAVAFGAMVIGTVFGSVAGYYGGWVDTIVMRVVDFLYSLPGLLVAVVALGVIGGGYWVAVGVLVVLTAPYDTRLIRGATLEQRGRPYVDAARSLGLSSPRIMARHVWPNVAPLVIANSFLNFAFTLVTLASLAFLGLGAGPGATDWGQMLNQNVPALEDNPLAPLAPGIAIVLLAVSVNLIGDWLYERLSDRGMGR